MRTKHKKIQIERNHGLSWIVKENIAKALDLVKKESIKPPFLGLGALFLNLTAMQWYCFSP